MRCSRLAAGPPARTLRVADGCEPAKFFQDAEQKHALVKANDADSGQYLPMVERVSGRIVQAAGLAQQTQWRVALV